MTGIILIAIGLGHLSVCVFIYQGLAGKLFPPLEATGEWQSREFGILDDVLYHIWPVLLPINPIVLRSALQLTGVAASTLIVVGVAQHFGVHSALVVVTVTLVGYLLRHIIRHARDSSKSVLSSESGEPLRPN